MAGNRKRFVKITKAELSRRFSEYNALYFDNQLTLPDYFELWTPCVKCVGMVRAIYSTKSKKSKKVSTAFHINARCYRWTDDNLRGVMVHEMIHMAIKDYMRPVRWWHWIIPPRQHDKMFVNFMNELNGKFGLDIAVRAKFMREYIKKKKPDK